MVSLKNMAILSGFGLCICIILALLGLRYIEGNRHTRNLEIMQDSVRYYENQNGTLTATVGALQLNADEMQDIVIQQNAEIAALAKEFHRVKTAVHFGSEIEFTGIGAKFDEPIVLGNGNDTNVVTIPEFERSGEIAADWYKLKYRVTNDSLQIPKFETWTKTTVLTGVKRKWFLGRQTITTDITNTNPHIKINDIISAETVVPNPWYKKWYVWGAAGLVAGVAIAK